MISFRTISSKFLFACLLIGIFTLSAIATMLIFEEKHSIEEMLMSKANSIADFMAKISVSSFANYDYMSLDTLANEVKKDPDVDYAVFYDSENNAINQIKSEKQSSIVLERKIVSDSGLALGYLKIGFNKNKVLEHVKFNVIISIIIVVCTCFLYFLGIRFLTKKVILTPLKNLEEAATRIAGGDLSTAIEIKGEDEIEVLKKMVNEMSGSLKGIVQDVKTITSDILKVTDELGSSAKSLIEGAKTQKESSYISSENIKKFDESLAIVSEKTDRLAEASRNISASLSQMNASINLLAQSSDAFSKIASDTASSIEEMFASIKEISDSIEELSAISEQTNSSLAEINASIKEIENAAVESAKIAEHTSKEVSENGMSSIDAIETGMEQINYSMKDISKVISSLSKRSEEVTKILKVIYNITDNTKLIALNAAILAAQSGSQGKGFDIVAEEVKSLATQTSSSADEIEQIVNSIKEDIIQAVETSKLGQEKVDNGITLIKTAKSTFKGILDASSDSSLKAKLIQKSTSEVAFTIKGIFDASRNLSNHIEKISSAVKEQYKGSKMILDSAEKVKEVSFNIKTSAKEQSEASGQILNSVYEISNNSEYIAKELSTQKDKSLELVKLIASVENVAQNTAIIAERIDDIVKRLTNTSKMLSEELNHFKI